MDPRLAAGGLRDLVVRNSTALPDEEEIIAASEVLGFERSERAGTAIQNRWQSIIVMMDDRNRLDEFINYTVNKKGLNSKKAMRIRAWLTRRANLSTLGEAVKECLIYSEDIRDALDPRETKMQLQALYAAVKQIIAGLADSPTRTELFEGIADAEAASKPAMSAAYKASGAVDQLVLGIDITRAAVNRMPSQTSGVDIFSTEFLIVGQLLTSHDGIYEAITEVLSLLREANPRAFDSSGA